MPSNAQSNETARIMRERADSQRTAAEAERLAASAKLQAYYAARRAAQNG